MGSFTVTTELQDDIPVVTVTGYFERLAGVEVQRHIATHCASGRTQVVLDLGPCEVLSSPGVSTIVELALDLQDDHDGSLIMCGLDKLQTNVLSLVGIDSMATIVPSLAEALAAARA